jgi:hypothetical protein
MQIMPVSDQAHFLFTCPVVHLYHEIKNVKMIFPGKRAAEPTIPARFSLSFPFFRFLIPGT